MRLLVLVLLGSMAFHAEELTTGVIAGRVVNAQTGDAIPGAVVHLLAANVRQGSGGDPASRDVKTTAQQDGSFRFEGLSAGMYFSSAEATGFVPTPKPLRGGNQAIPLESGQQIIDRMVQMTPQGVISGRVIDDAGEPVPGITVTTFIQQASNGRLILVRRSQAKTNVAGEFRIIGLTAGGYYMAADPATEKAKESASAEPELQLVRTFFPESITFDGAGKVQAQAGQEISGQTIRLQKAATFHIRGKVASDAKGKLQILISNRSSAPMRGFDRRAAVGADGRFDIEGLPQGSFTLRVTAPGARGQGHLLAQQDVNLAASDVNGLVLAERPMLAITGRVRVEGMDAANLSSMRLSLSPAEDFGFGGFTNSLVRADGSFSIENLDPGKYVLELSGSPAGTYVKTITFNQQDVLGKWLDLGQLGSGQLAILLRPGVAQVEAAVENESVPFSGMGVLVSAALHEDGLGSTFTRGRNNILTFRNVPPGRYYAYAVDQFDYAIWQLPEFLGQMQGQGTEVEVSENDHKQIKVSKVSGGSIEQSMAQLGLNQ